MRGAHRIVISNANIRYDFTVRRNITIIKGNSATGKTTLVEMVSDYYESGETSGVTLSCDKKCRVVGGRDWKAIIELTKDSIVFIDEENEFLPSDEFARAVRDSDNYYVLITREGLPNLPYSVDEIYGIRTSGKFMSVKPVYNEFYHIYSRLSEDEEGICPSCIITEDTNSGYEFFRKITDPSQCDVISAGGKSNVFTEGFENKDGKTVIIADGAAFGSEMARVSELTDRYPNLILYLPESFEWLILKSGIIKDGDIDKILNQPEKYIESREYFSWERYFNSLLVEKTRNGYLRYSKKKMNPAYYNRGIAASILSTIKKIVFPLNKEP